MKISCQPGPQRDKITAVATKLTIRGTSAPVDAATTPDNNVFSAPSSFLPSSNDNVFSAPLSFLPSSDNDNNNNKGRSSGDVSGSLS